jgi:uncharacterized protein YoxC
MKTQKNSSSGFMLIGLLVVIVIIALAFIYTYNSTKKTKDQAVERLDTSLQGAQKSVNSVRNEVNDITAQEQKKLEDAQKEMNR